MAYPALVVAVHRNAVDLKYLDRDEETNVSVALVQAASQRVVARYRAVAAIHRHRRLRRRLRAVAFDALHSEFESRTL